MPAKSKNGGKSKAKAKGTVEAAPKPAYQLKHPLIVDFYEGEAPIVWGDLDEKPYRAIFKLTHGNWYTDSQVVNYIAQAKQLDVKYGLYHFLRPNHIAAQVDLFCSTIIKVGGFGNMPPIVDVEYTPPKFKKDDDFPRGAEWGGQVKAFCDGVETNLGQKPIIYTNANFWNYTLDKNGKPPAWSSDYLLWVGWYPDPVFPYVDKNSIPAAKSMPAGWDGKYAFWQYAEGGRTEGYAANDLSIPTPEFVEWLDAWDAEINKVPVPVPVPVPTPAPPDF